MSGPVTSVPRVEDVQIFLKDPVYLELCLKHPAIKTCGELEAKLYMFQTTPVSRFDLYTIAQSVTVLSVPEGFRASFDLIKVNLRHYRPEVPRGFQEVKVPRLRDNGTGW